MVSTGKGRTTCAFFTKDGKHIIYASTHLALILVRLFRTGENMATNISGLCMTAMIFSWQIWMVRS